MSGIGIGLGVEIRSDVGGFRPTKISSLALWLRPERLPVSGTVSSWPDSSGNGNDADQATAASRPTVVAGALDGKRAADFDGSDDLLDLTAGIDLTAGFEIWGVVGVSAAAAVRRLVASTDASDLAILSATHVVSTTIGGVTDAISTAVTTGQHSLLAWRRDASDNLGAEENGTVVTTGSPAETGTLTANSISDSASLWDDHIVELVIYSKYLSDAEHLRLLSYFKSKYPSLGITIPTIEGIITEGGVTMIHEDTDVRITE